MPKSEEAQQLDKIHDEIRLIRIALQEIATVFKQAEKDRK